MCKLHNWQRNLRSPTIMLVLIAEVVGCLSDRRTTAVKTELDILKENHMMVAWLPLTGLQRFQWWLEEHVPWISQPVANFTFIWFPWYLTDPFRSKPEQTAFPYPLSIAFITTPAALSFALEATFSVSPFPHSCYFQIPGWQMESGKMAQENQL